MRDLSKYEKPLEFSDVGEYFRAEVVGGLIPYLQDLPEDFKPQRHGRNEYCELASRWFFRGLRGIRFKEGIDRTAALCHLRAALSSWNPSHEEKISGVGYLLSRWGCEELDPPKPPQKDGRKRSEHSK